MGYAVELTLDPVSTEAVRTLWHALTERGVNPTLPQLNAQPHISLAVYETLDPAAMGDELAAFAGELAPIDTVFSAVGTFPTNEGVVYLAPVVTAELLAIHARFHARMEQLGLRSNAYYRPGHWVPHCTIALEIPPADIPTAIALARASNVFGPISLTAVELIEFRPVQIIYRIPLQGSTDTA